MTQTLGKAIMRRPQLKTKFPKTKRQENLNSFKQQRKFSSGLYKKERKNYYNALR